MVPDDAELRSCIRVVLAGLLNRANVGVGGLEEAIHALEEVHEAGETSYRFALEDGKILAQVDRRSSETAKEDVTGEAAGWRTLVELVS